MTARLNAMAVADCFVNTLLDFPVDEFRQQYFVMGINVTSYECLNSQITDNYRKTSNISRTLVVNKIVDNSDVVGASPVGAAPTTSSFSTYDLTSLDWAFAQTANKENIKSPHFTPIVRGIHW